MTMVYIPLEGIVWPFRVKYIMFEYNVSMAVTNTAKGLSSALTHIAGTLIGSLMSRRIATNMGYLRFILITVVLSWLVTSLLMYFGCDNRNIVGLQGGLADLQSVSNHCDCDPTLNLLSCGSDGLTYLSPCYAGCVVSVSAIFTNCSSLTSTDQSGIVTPGLCDVGCFHNFVMFNVLTATQTFIFALNNMPRHLLALRILEPEDRAFGSAFLHFAPYVASLPAPYIFGKWMEQMCLVWSSDHCSLYDRDEIRHLMIGVEVLVAGLTVILFAAMVLVCRHLDRKSQSTLQLENERISPQRKRVGLRMLRLNIILLIYEYFCVICYDY
ncbi:solute carrier organic anion transporter family member [Plakobranchus ocellatus]|uniref:Solute carrier organic anion transporter family member n=1 Tax=Plakobranchus ocellatus TaxID=259542 RepID=A0AAV4A5X4_9GAST|nr:solute carrier organic anion transporter family member [Plakobranchus ocellatus]